MQQHLTDDKSIYLQISQMIETDILRGILLEEERDGAWRGYTAEYSPVAVQAEGSFHNQVCSVRLERVEQGVLWGSLA